MVSEKLIFSTKHQAPSTNASAARIKRPGRLLFTYRLPPTAYRLPPTACRLPPTAYRLPPTAYRLPPTAYRLPPTACRLPPTACRLPPAACHQPPATSRLPPATSHQPPAASHLPPATCRLPPATSHQPPATSRPSFSPPDFPHARHNFPKTVHFLDKCPFFGHCLKMGHVSKQDVSKWDTWGIERILFRPFFAVLVTELL